MRKIYRSYLTASALLLCLAACRKEANVPCAEPSGTMLFAVSETIPDLETKSSGAMTRLQAGDYTVEHTADILPVREAETKAAGIYRSTDATPLGGAPIAVWAYNMPAASSEPSAWTLDPGTASGPVQASRDAGSGQWKPASAIGYNQAVLADTYQTRWFAVAPYEAIGNGLTITAPAAATAPTLIYTVPSAVSNQYDIMYAAPNPRGVTDNTPVALAFRHALTGVRIKADKGISVTEATLSGVYDNATFNLFTGEWTSHAKSTVSPSFTANLTSAEIWDQSGTQDYVKDPGIFMMVPQWLPDGAKLTLTVDGVTVEADLSGHKWEMGKLVTYRVVALPKEYHISVEENDYALIVSADRLEAVASVNSYAVTQGSSIPQEAGWKVAGVYDTRSGALAGGTSTSSLWTAQKSGNNLQVKVNEKPAASSRSVTSVLQVAAERGSADAPWNLANPHGGADKIVESANTYVINAPGYYRIPLVAGNGIKNDIANTAAYPSNFVDYKGQPFQSPYLHSSSSGVGTPTSGDVVWEEIADMVENLSVVQDAVSGIYWLTFRIQASKIEQGCTVVSVKDNSNTVMWSWLLWCTDFESSGQYDVSCQYSSTNDFVYFMSRNLGWTVDNNVTCSDGLDGWVRVEAENDPSVYKVVYVRVPIDPGSQIARDASKSGHGPYFQWGRKDAMPPSTLASSWSYRSAGSKKPEDLITYPGHHFTAAYYPFTNDGGKLLSNNWWSATATSAGQDLATVKTVYDPCPAGYTVPRHDAFNGFYNQTSAPTGLTGSPAWITFSSGYQGGDGSNALTFAAGGRRNAGATNGTPISTAYGQYWVAVPQGGNTARRVSIGPLSSGETFWVYLPRTNTPDPQPDPYGRATEESQGFFSKAGEMYIRPAREQ